MPTYLYTATRCEDSGDRLRIEPGIPLGEGPRRFIKAAGKKGGVTAKVTKKIQKEDSEDERIDIEVIAGIGTHFSSGQFGKNA